MGTLARYLRRMIFNYFLLVLVGLAAFILSIDLAINSKEIIESRAGEFSALVDYSLLRLPEIASLLLPARARVHMSRNSSPANSTIRCTIHGRRIAATLTMTRILGTNVRVWSWMDVTD